MITNNNNKQGAGYSYPYAYYPVSAQTYPTTTGNLPQQQINSFDSNEKFGNMDENDGDERGGYCSVFHITWHAWLSMLFFLACTFFSILVIYSLVSNNTEAIHNACTDLYPYMVTRTALSFCVFFAMCTYGLMYGATKQPERNPVLVFFFLIYFVVLAIWGAVVISKSMIGNATCYNALYDKTFHAPLLGDLGWVYIVIDVFYALCTVLIILRTQFVLGEEEDQR